MCFFLFVCFLRFGFGNFFLLSKMYCFFCYVICYAVLIDVIFKMFLRQVTC